MLVNIASLNAYLGDYEKAAVQIQKVIDAGDRYLLPEAYAMQASLLRKLGDYTGVESACTHALDINLDNVEARRQLAVLRLLQKDWSTAVREAETAYNLDSSGAYVRDTLAVACHMSGDTARRDALIAEMKTTGDDTSGIDGLMAGTKTLEDIYLK